MPQDRNMEKLNLPAHTNVFALPACRGRIREWLVESALNAMQSTQGTKLFWPFVSSSIAFPLSMGLTLFRSRHERAALGASCAY